MSLLLYYVCRGEADLVGTALVSSEIRGVTAGSTALSSSGILTADIRAYTGSVNFDTGTTVVSGAIRGESQGVSSTTGTSGITGSATLLLSREASLSGSTTLDSNIVAEARGGITTVSITSVAASGRGTGMITSGLVGNSEITAGLGALVPRSSSLIGNTGVNFIIGGITGIPISIQGLSGVSADILGQGRGNTVMPGRTSSMSVIRGPLGFSNDVTNTYVYPTSSTPPRTLVGYTQNKFVRDFISVPPQRVITPRVSTPNATGRRGRIIRSPSAQIGLFFQSIRTNQ